MKKIIPLFLFFTLNFLQAQRIDPLLTKDLISQEQWVDSLLNTMSVEEKIGQLFMIQAYSNNDKNHQKEIIKMIEKYHVGNLIFMKGTPQKQVELTNLYQSKAKKVPLLIGFDGEWGLDMRLKNTYRFPWNMTLGAIQDEKLIEKLGKRIGEHCKRVGIHMNFAPVVDINTNANNPIIGNRSFGENKENVTEKSIAFIKGMQGVGVLANVKHFPGHGDTSQDSHKTLPSVNFSKQRINDVEFYPYEKTFDQGVASVMVAHLSVPSLESNTELPSSLSKKVVTDILKDQLGFQGLIFTDGLNMKGAANYATPAEINLAAFLAGNDMLLIPEDVPNTVSYFLDLNKRGLLSEKRINESVRKVLKAKYLVGLHHYKPVITDNLQKDLNTTEDKLLHRSLVKNSLTIIKNKNNLLPLTHLENKKIAYVKMGDANNQHFMKMLKNYTNVDVIYSKKLKWLKSALKKYNTVIVGFHKSNKNPWKSYKFTKKELTWLQEIAKEKTVVLDVFASPYSLMQIDSFSDIDAVMVSYQNSKLSQELSAQAIFGAFGVSGKLPISIENQFTEGSGINTKSLNVLGYSIPEEVGMSSDSLRVVDKYINMILRDKMAPGGQVLVARNGQVVLNKSFGYHTELKKRKVKNSDIYDLASITKILASLPLIIKSDDVDTLSINSTIQELLPSFKNSNKAQLSLKSILSHYSGLKSWIPFYLKTQNPKTKENLPKLYKTKKTGRYSIKVADSLYLDKTYKKTMLREIKKSNLSSNLRYKYSDLGYYIIKEVLEKKYQVPLNKKVETDFYKPLGMNRTSYLPRKKFRKSQIVPTEKDTYFRNQLVHGYVHDMGAAMLGGVGGHAGLFANANDVAKMMQMYMQKGEYGGKRYFSEATFNQYNKRYFSEVENRRGLGFDKPQIDPKQKNTCACVSEESFGHSGFTGTYTWADPQTGIVYVFLSNRVHPTMDNKGMVKSGVRTKIQKAIQQSIIE